MERMDKGQLDRLADIQRKVDDWFSFNLKEGVNDIMPDVVYLLEEVKKYKGIES